ncbi:TonB-dependent receptor [Marinoscillum furvescens]|uniref:TonB-dependent receptor n=1 Tax=Marinoscillum furvescens TaxID=1026 RepID=UPI001473A368|nr:TonB-dependent receptor [Marinoscillum furvescens]
MIAFLLMMWSSLTHGQKVDDLHIPPADYPLPELLSQLAAQNIKLAYSTDKLPRIKVTIPHSPISLNEVLQLLKSHRVYHHQVSETITLTYKPPRTFTLQGIVRDAENGEVLIGASIQKVGTTSGSITNNYGHYSLTLEEGTHVIGVSFIGFKRQLDTIRLAQNLNLNFDLQPMTEQLTEVIVSAKEPDFNVESIIPGINTMDLSTKGQIPYFLGEVDILQGAALLPGINTLGEDANGLNIRGGGVDQNLILLDEATVYNPNHLFGLISVFNPEAVNNVEIMKGFVPPSYGGRASSVITVHQKEGDDQNYHITGGIGLVSARFIAEGPIKKEESSFILSGRQSLFNISLDDGNRSSFQDVNAKINWKFNKRNTFYASGYFGNDRSQNTFETVRNWGNRNFSLRWNHLHTPRLFTNFSAIVSQYNYRITQPREAASFVGNSRIIDYTLKSDWSFTLSPNQHFEFGGNLILHRLKPGDRIPFDEDSSSDSLLLDTEHGLETALYASHETQLFSRLKLLYGFRFSSLHTIGPEEVYLYAANKPRNDENIVDTISYDQGKVAQSYFGFEPRVSAAFRVNETSTLKASYSKNIQYLHLISNTITPSPTDIWKLSDTHIAPTVSNHYSLGYYKNFKENVWESYLDIYYKQISDLIAYKNGADLLFNENPETELLNGTGRAYGMELFIKKNKGRYTGWLSYTLSRSEVQVAGPFEESTINNGDYFPADHDRRHDISLVNIYQFTPRLSGSFSFNYNSGRPYTLPEGKYYYEGNVIPLFGKRNNNRLPDYHRLDLSIKWEGRTVKKDGSPKKWRDYWTLVVYNVYGRDNVYSYIFDENESSGNTSVTPYSIFDSVIPAITYHFKL